MSIRACHSEAGLGLTCHAPGISTYDVSLEKQEVLVKGTIDYDTLLEKIKKTGKEVSGTRCAAAGGWIELTVHSRFALERPSNDLLR